MKKKSVKKTAAKARRPKLSVVTTEAPRSTKKRDFWSLFSNVKNHKFQEQMQRGNYLDEFVLLIEDMPEEDFNALVNAPKYSDTLIGSISHKDVIRTLKLDKYDLEIVHLCTLIGLHNNGESIPTHRTMETFKSRIDLGPGTQRLLDQTREWHIQEHLRTLPSSDEELAGTIVVEDFGTEEIDKDTDIKTDLLLGAIEKIKEYSSLLDEETPSAAVIAPSRTPSFVTAWKDAQELMLKFDHEYATRKAYALRTKITMKRVRKEFESGQETEGVYKETIVARQKAQREFLVVEKVQKLAHEHFEKVAIELVDDKALREELNTIGGAGFSHLFDSMNPSVDVYNKEMERRSNKQAVAAQEMSSENDYSDPYFAMEDFKRANASQKIASGEGGLFRRTKS